MMIGKMIGRGNTAEIFEWEEGKVIKLFHEGYSVDAVEKEFRNASAVANFEFDQPKLYGRADYENRNGIVYERINGITLLDYIMQEENLDTSGKILAEVHKKLLSNKVHGVYRHKDILKYNIETITDMNQESKNDILKLLSELPDAETLCHGDFHPGNILIQQDKYMIIDWMNVCSGHPYSDVARTIYLIEMTPVPGEIEDKESFMQMKKAMGDTYLRYMEIDRQEIEKWLILISAAQINDGVSEEERQIIIEYLRHVGYWKQ